MKWNVYIMMYMCGAFFSWVNELWTLSMTCNFWPGLLKGFAPKAGPSRLLGANAAKLAWNTIGQCRGINQSHRPFMLFTPLKHSYPKYVISSTTIKIAYGFLVVLNMWSITSGNYQFTIKHHHLFANHRTKCAMASIAAMLNFLKVFVVNLG